MPGSFRTGGTFALYSLLCRHAKLSLLPNQQAADEELSTYKLEAPQESNRDIWMKKILEKHQKLRTVLLIVVLLGTCMVIGDGVLTPAISGTVLLFVLPSQFSNEPLGHQFSPKLFECLHSFMLHFEVVCKRVVAVVGIILMSTVTWIDSFGV